MKLETIYRYPDRTDVFLTAYLLGAVDRCAFSGARPALLICPGGGFAACSNREEEPIAMHFAAQGYQVFVLQYSLGDQAAFPAPICDAAWAMRLIRGEAKRFWCGSPQGCGDGIFRRGICCGGIKRVCGETVGLPGGGRWKHSPGRGSFVLSSFNGMSGISA